MHEIIGKRTVNTKTFDISDEPGPGTTQISSRMSPQHYEAGQGVLEDINMDIDGDRVNRCHYDVKLMDGKIGYEGSDPDGNPISLELEGVASDPIIEGNKATWKDVATDTDFELEFLPSMVRANRIVRSAAAPKTAVYTSGRARGSRGNLLNLGADDKGQKAEIVVDQDGETIEVPGGRGDFELKRMRQNWTGKVAKMDQRTRKKEWSDEVVFPVVLDPTSTFEIGANADDARCFIAAWTALVLTTPNQCVIDNYAGPSIKDASANRFTGITIPQSSTITTSTFKGYFTRVGATNAFSIAADARQAPGIPGTPLVAIDRTSTIGNTAFTIPNTGAENVKGNFDLKSIAVTTMVQALVNAWEYSSGEMVFYINTTSSHAASKWGAIYHRDWGTSKDAELVIDFTEPAGPHMPDQRTGYHG